MLTKFACSPQVGLLKGELDKVEQSNSDEKARLAEIKAALGAPCPIIKS